jgi:hypothetical protein
MTSDSIFPLAPLLRTNAFSGTGKVLITQTLVNLPQSQVEPARLIENCAILRGMFQNPKIWETEWRVLIDFFWVCGLLDIHYQTEP